MNARRLLTLLCVWVLCLAAASPASGLSSRVFVSARSGNDANSCNNILTPCQTFAGSVLQVNPGGDVIVLDSGGYGAVTITKSLTIEAPPGVLAFIHPSSGNAITVSAGPTDVVILRGLTLNSGAASGIDAGSVGSLYVENCAISGFFNRGIAFTSGGRLFVKDSVVRDSFVGIGVSSATTAKASVYHSRIEGNTHGLAANDGAKASLRETSFSGNTGAGIYAEVNAGGTAEINVEGCLVANNLNGIRGQGSSGSWTIRFSDSTVTDNDFGSYLGCCGGTILSRLNNTLEGNGTDATGGIGVYNPH